jgi:SAM-dependent methyltransferase
MRLLRILLGKLRFRIDQARDGAFDRRHGVDTSTAIARPELAGMPEVLKRCTNGTHASNISLFRRIIRHSGVNLAEFSFVDLGCGSGRALLLASAYPFKEVIGIEADATLCKRARENVAAWTRRDGARIEITQEDAREFTPPPGNLFIYMYNPFTGTVFETVTKRLAALAKEPGRSVVIAYCTDVHADVIERTGRFERRPLRPRRFWGRPTVSYFYNGKLP